MGPCRLWALYSASVLTTVRTPLSSFTRPHFMLTCSPVGLTSWAPAKSDGNANTNEHCRRTLHALFMVCKCVERLDMSRASLEKRVKERSFKNHAIACSFLQIRSNCAEEERLLKRQHDSRFNFPKRNHSNVVWQTFYLYKLLFVLSYTSLPPTLTLIKSPRRRRRTTQQGDDTQVHSNWEAAK